MKKPASGGLSRRSALKILGGVAAGSLLRVPLRARPGAAGTRRVDVVIVGAGFAGLTAARELMRQGRSVALLDARDRTGGRVKAGRIAGKTVDLGGMWVGPSQTHLLALLREHEIATTPQYTRGRSILEIGGRRTTGEGENASLGREGDAAYSALSRTLREMAANVPPEAPWTAPKAGEWDRLTMAEWIQAHAKNSAARKELELEIRGLFTVEPEQLSLLYFLFYVRSGNSLEELWGVEGAAQAFHVPGGMHQLAARLGDGLGDALALEAPVTAVAQDASGVTVSSPAGSWRGQFAIVAVPLPLSARLAYEPALPADRDALAQRSPMGSVIKYWVAYAEPFWRRHGLNGMATSDLPPTIGFLDASPPDASVGLLVGFVEARASLELARLSVEERRRIIVRRVVDLLGPEGADPVDYVDNLWSAEPWTRGCYGASMGPGVLSTLGPALRTPFDRIHWAGTETSPVWSGYIEGAVRSGERAAAEVRARLG